MAGSVQLALRIPADLYAWIDNQARERHITKADVIREALWAKHDG